jgi:hypothetical protein
MIKIDHNNILVDKQHSDLWLLLGYQVYKTFSACLLLGWHLPNLGSLCILTLTLTLIHILMLLNNLREMLELNNIIHSSLELAVLAHK